MLKRVSDDNVCVHVKVNCRLKKTTKKQTMCEQKCLYLQRDNLRHRATQMLETYCLFFSLGTFGFSFCQKPISTHPTLYHI